MPKHRTGYLALFIVDPVPLINVVVCKIRCCYHAGVNEVAIEFQLANFVKEPNEWISPFTL
jgi:hypothetical protein